MDGVLGRRDVLKLGAGGIAMTLGAGSFAAESKASPGWIDAHVHVWTPDVKKYPLARGFGVADMAPPSFTPEELFKHARPLGVARIVLIQMSFYGTDNSYMLDMIAAHKGTFSGVAVIDAASKPADEMRRLKKLGVRGFRIRSDRDQGKDWLAGDGMAAMWKCGAEERLALGCLVNPDALPAVDAMCRKFPDTPVVIDHFGRVGIDGTIRDADVKNLCDLARHKQVRVKVSAFYALGKKTAPHDDLIPLIRRLVDAFGPQRLMWATDCPYQVQEKHTYAASLALVHDRLDFLSADDRAWLLRKTAEAMFFA